MIIAVSLNKQTEKLIRKKCITTFSRDTTGENCKMYYVKLPIDLFRIPTNNGAESRSGCTKKKKKKKKKKKNNQETYENVHPNLVLVLLFVRTVQCGQGLYTGYIQVIHRKVAKEKSECII